MVNKINKARIKRTTARVISLYVFLFFLVIIPLILNWKNISYEMTMLDDNLIITNNYSFLSDFRNVFHAFEKDNFMSQKGENYYRPIQTVSFMIDAQINGEKPYAYHFSNILYHILTVIVLFFLLRKLGIHDNISFFLSLLFSVHPLFTDAIAWISGRGDLLAGLFCSVSFLFFIHYNFTKNKLFFLLHSLTFILALFSKEISVILPLVLIYYYWIILKNKYKIRVLVPFILVWGISVFAFFFLGHVYLNSNNILSLKAFISKLPVIPIFLGKLVIPVGLSSMPVFDILFTTLGLILFISSGIYILKLKIENKSLIILGIFWFLGFIIPAMFVGLPFVKVHFDYLECRAYLPSIGIFIALGVVLNEKIKERGINILLKTFIPVILTFSLISYNYSGDFADAVSFFSSLIKSNPGNAYAYSERGSIYITRNNFDLALADLDNSIKISPTYSDPYFGKGVLYNSMNNHIRAEYFYSIALNFDTLYPESNSVYENVFINLSSEKLNLKKYDETITLLKKGIRKYSDNCSLHNNLGLAYYYSTKFDSALYEYNRAIKLEQNVSSYYNNRGMVEYHLKDFTGALNDFNWALELKPDLRDTWGSRGMTKIELNDNEGAVSDLTKAISFDPGIGSAYYFRGIAFSKLNRITEAVRDWKKAVELGYQKATELLDRYKP